MCIFFLLKGEGLKEKHTIVQLKNYVFNTYTSNIAPCMPGDVALDELEFVKCPLLLICVYLGPITRLVSGQLAINCPYTHVPLVHKIKETLETLSFLKSDIFILTETLLQRHFNITKLNIALKTCILLAHFA